MKPKESDRNYDELHTMELECVFRMANLIKIGKKHEAVALCRCILSDLTFTQNHTRRAMQYMMADRFDMNALQQILSNQETSRHEGRSYDLEEIEKEALKTPFQLPNLLQAKTAKDSTGKKNQSVSIPVFPNATLEAFQNALVFTMHLLASFQLEDSRKSLASENKAQDSIRADAIRDEIQKIKLLTRQYPVLYGWESARELKLAEKAPVFPLDVFPTSVTQHIQAICRSKQIHTNQFANVLLSACSFVYKRNYSVGFNPQNVEPLTFYHMLVADPRSGKSRAISLFEDAVRPINDKLQDIKQAQQNEYRQRLQANETSDEAISYLVENQNFNDDSYDLLATITDATTEKVETLMQYNNGETFLLNDEPGIIKSISKIERINGARNDFFRRMYSGQSHRTARIGRSSVYVKDGRLSMLIGSQPLEAVRFFSNIGLIESGMTARFSVGVSDALENQDENHVEDASASVQWFQNFVQSEYYRTREAKQNDLLLFDSSALDLLHTFKNRQQAKNYDTCEFDDYYIRNIPSFAIRVAGLLHLLRCYEENINPLEKRIGTKIMKNALRIVEYFLQSMSWVTNKYDSIQINKLASQIMRYAYASPTLSHKKGQIFRKFQSFHISGKEIARALNQLEEHNFIKTIRTRDPNSDTHYINQIVFRALSVEDQERYGFAPLKQAEQATEPMEPVDERVDDITYSQPVISNTTSPPMQ